MIRPWPRIAALTTVAALGLTSCSPLEPFAYRVAGAAVELLWPVGCGGALDELQVSASGPAQEGEDSDLRVWHIEATGDPVEIPDSTALRIGQAPDGFEVVVDLEAPLDPERQYHGYADIEGSELTDGGRWGISFTPEHLDGDWSDEPYEC